MNLAVPNRRAKGTIALLPGNVPSLYNATLSDMDRIELFPLRLINLFDNVLYVNWLTM